MIANKKILVVILVFMSLLVLFQNSLIVSSSYAEEKPLVVTTTNVLASIVEDLAGDSVVVEVIVSPSACPAHYDVKPSDVYKIKEADLILIHGFEPWVNDLVSASGSSAPIVTIKGPWNTPDLLKEKYISVANALQRYLGIDVEINLNKSLDAINKTAVWLKEFAKSNGFEGVPVVAMMWQVGFLKFLGFNVVATYPPPEKVSLNLYNQIIANASKYGAKIVVDNLQSGTELGRKIADEIGGVEVALTNFPGIAPELNNMTEVMKYNAELMARALELVRLSNASTQLESNIYSSADLQNEVNTWRYAFACSAALNIVLIIIILLSRRKGGS